MLTVDELIYKLNEMSSRGHGELEAVVVDNDLFGWEISGVEPGEGTEIWITLGRKISD